MHILKTSVARCILLSLAILWTVAPARAEQLCDPSFEDCRARLIELIRAETQGIDVAFWFMEDARYTNELIRKHQEGVPIRVIVDPRANSTYPLNADRLAELQQAGIPMRKRIASGILHWKMMLFDGQNTVEFSGANYSPWALKYVTPYEAYTDEAIYFSDDSSVVNSFRTKYDSLWTNTTSYANYANISGALQARYGTFTKDPELNFPPLESFRNRSVSRYTAETEGIDVLMFRITDRAHSDAMITAVARGVPVRLVTEPDQYRDPSRYWHAWNVDRMYMGGVQIRHRAHAGSMHQKSVLLHSQAMTIFGSSNWTSPSSSSQEEHNYFTTKSWFYQWFVNQFERKWNNRTGIAETQPFVPLPPDRPSYVAPADMASGVPVSGVTLRWLAGVWAHKYDIYFGTNPTPPLLESDVKLGESRNSSDVKQYLLPTLQPGTTYYWQIVSKTMADQTAAGPVRSFTTEGAAPPPGPNGEVGPGDIVLYAARATVAAGHWSVVNDSTAADGSAMASPNAGAAKITAPLANPANYFELTFDAQANVAYRLWIRGRAQSNHWGNDSVHVQFSGSVTSSGSAIWRIGTTSGTEVNLEDCSGCGLSGWGWQDNGWGVGVLGPQIRFASAGTQTIRIQTREDGFTIDQILLSPELYLNSAPGTLKNDTTILPCTGCSGGPPPPSGGEEIVLYAGRATVRSGGWSAIALPDAAGGIAIRHPNQGAAKITTPLASPVHYFELTFDALAGVPYRIWIRSKAEGNHWSNDSVFAQFSGSVNASGTPIWRIGTTSGTDLNLEDCSGCGLSGWGWQDNGWGVGVLGPEIRFGTAGPQTIRIQTREDGLTIDQIVLSTSTYLSAAPGALKDDTTILPERR